jgi:hypothetical protein
MLKKGVLKKESPRYIMKLNGFSNSRWGFQLEGIMGNISHQSGRHSGRHYNRTGSYILLTVILILFLAILACSFDFLPQDPSQQETGVAQSVEDTLSAEQALTEQAIQTNAPGDTPVIPTESVNTDATIQAQQATLDAQNTLAAQSSPTDEAATATETPSAASLDLVSITDWKMSFWAPINSGCKVKDVGCWKMNDDYKIHLGIGDLVMVSRNPVIIEQTWPNPYLVLWHKYKFERNAQIEISADSVWSTMKDLTKKSSGGNWVHEAINLNNYKGKELLVRFIAGGIWGSGGIRGSDWFVNEVQIVPDYAP